MNQGSEVPKQREYPSFVSDDPARQHRWDLAMAIAPRIIGEDASSSQVRQTARWLFHREDLPTD